MHTTLFLQLLLLACCSLFVQIDATPLVRPNAVNENNSNFTWDGPRLFIIGAPKCATTSLSDLLHSHPGVCRSDFKEPQYFNHFWHMGERFYRKRMVKHQRCTGSYLDATPDYLHSSSAAGNMLQAWGAQRIAEKRLVVILRDPISRQFSWYNHEIKLCVPALRKFMYNRKQKTLVGAEVEKACSKDKHCKHLCTNVAGKSMSYKHELVALNSFDDYVASSQRHDVNLYGQSLARWLRVFQRRQVLVLNFEQLVSNNSLIDTVAQHYNLKPFRSGSRLPKDNSMSIDPTLQTQLLCSSREKLEKLYTAPTQELYALLARNDPANPRSILEPAFGTFRRAKCVSQADAAVSMSGGGAAESGDAAFNAAARLQADADVGRNESQSISS